MNWDRRRFWCERVFEDTSEELVNVDWTANEESSRSEAEKRKTPIETGRLCEAKFDGYRVGVG